MMHNPIVPSGLRHNSMPNSGMRARGRLLVCPVTPPVCCHVRSCKPNLECACDLCMYGLSCRVMLYWAIVPDIDMHAFHERLSRAHALCFDEQQPWRPALWCLHA